MHLGEMIRKLRIENGLTQKQLGELCGMADSAIRRYESGRANPKIETIGKIADALGVSIDYLMTGKKSVSDVLTDILSESNTIAAHLDGDEFTEEELEEIRKFAEFVKSKRKPE